MARPFDRPSKSVESKQDKPNRKVIPDIPNSTKSEKVLEWKEGDVCTISETDYTEFRVILPPLKISDMFRIMKHSPYHL